MSNDPQNSTLRADSDCLPDAGPPIHHGSAEVPAFELSGVGVEFTTREGQATVLEGVDLTVGRGEIVGIVGKSGTGKSTLLRILAGLERPTAGSVRLNGTELDGPSSSAITVFQDYSNALLPWRTVARNVRLGVESRLPRDEQERRVSEALRMVGLLSSAHLHPGALSGGMQQRVQIARALAVQPEVLLMDEPFGALDAMTRATLQDEMLRLHATTKTTIVFITHDMDEAVYLSDRVVLISGQPGSITFEMATGLPRERNQLETRERPEFLHARHVMLSRLTGGSV